MSAFPASGLSEKVAGGISGALHHRRGAKPQPPPVLARTQSSMN